MAIVLSCALGVWAGSRFAQGADDKADADAQALREKLVQQAWTISDVVMDRHIDPPVRQQMLLGAVQSLLQTAGAPVPEDLSRRVSGLAAPEQVTSFLQGIWPKAVKASSDKLEAAFVQGLLQGVPGEATMVSAEEMKVLDQINHNRYVGTGIQITMNPKENAVQIVVAFPNGPARRGGARSGDLIIEAAGKNVTGANIRQVVDLLRGEEGTSVTMVVRQPGAKETRKISMIRGVIPFETVVGHRRLGEEKWDYHAPGKEKIAYLRLASIRSSTLHELRQVESRLRDQGFQALVLDLRFRTSGEMHDAALVADGLLDSGVLWRVQNAHQPVKEYKADRECLFRGWPIAVLTGGAGRDVSTVLLAAALQDNHRATLVGDVTWTDGYLTSLVPMPQDQGTLSMRTGMVLRGAKPKTKSSGVTIPPPGWAVEPDQAVALSNAEREELTQWAYAQEREAQPSTKAPADPQLSRAVELLQQAMKSAGLSAKSAS
jgi:carboxyl-terminal processing protease